MRFSRRRAPTTEKERSEKREREERKNERRAREAASGGRGTAEGEREKGILSVTGKPLGIVIYGAVAFYALVCDRGTIEMQMRESRVDTRTKYSGVTRYWRTTTGTNSAPNDVESIPPAASGNQGRNSSN